MAMNTQEQNFVSRMLDYRERMLALYAEAKEDIALWNTKGWYYDAQNPAPSAISDDDLASVASLAYLSANALSNIVGTVTAYRDMLEANGSDKFSMLVNAKP